MAISKIRLAAWKDEAALVSTVLANAPTIDKHRQISTEEFLLRQMKVMQVLEQAGVEAGVVYSDEHYHGDVPYLGGNVNITVESVAGVLGKNGFHIMAGQEGGCVAEQLARRAGAKVHKVEMFKIADEEYPIEPDRVEEVIEAAAGCHPKRIALLTARSVLPVAMYDFLSDYVGGAQSVVDLQEPYWRIRYEKSDAEMALISDSALVADTAVRGMLAVLKPGMLETQVAEWGYLIAKEMGAESMGVEIMVTANEANRTLIGKALNRPIREGDFVQVGIAPERDGLNSCQRVSVVAVDDPAKVTADQKYWLDFIEEAYRVGYDAFVDVAENDKPAYLEEKAIVDFFASRSAEVSKRVGHSVDLVKQKPYAGTHNTGYTECHEFFGAVTLNAREPLGRQIAMMLDVAVKGNYSAWDEVVVPGLDYLVIEKTLGKFGKHVEPLTKLPLNVQHLIGRVEG